MSKTTKKKRRLTARIEVSLYDQDERFVQSVGEDVETRTVETPGEQAAFLDEAMNRAMAPWTKQKERAHGR